jgi:hypothetical protein
MRSKATIAAALALALGGLAGIDNPMKEAKRAATDDFPRPMRMRLRNAHYMRGFDPNKRKAKNKQAKKSKARNRKR